MIIRSIFRNPITELSVVIFLSMAIFVFVGAGPDGKASFLGRFSHQYVEEFALAINAPQVLSSLQLADMHTVSFGVGSDVVGPKNANAPLVRDSAIITMNTPDTDVLDQINDHRNSVIEYTAQEGDLLSFIATDYGVSTDSVMWANKLKNADNISPGQVLRIPPITGVIHIVVRGDTPTLIAQKYQASEDRIMSYNHIPKSGVLVVGDEIIVPEGKMQNSKSKTLPRAIQDAFAHLPDLKDFFKIPTPGFNWGKIHGRNGVDVANQCGTSIYAAADGVVTSAMATGYNGGFGKYLKIAHQNGTETLYAHTSKLLVVSGQQVARGDQIALMGTTGRSTGCHLHFEVHGAKNPLAKN